MRAAVAVPVTVKTRLGVDDHDSYEFVRDFVAEVAAAGCTTFIVHARKAWLSGLSPKQNREIPPLDYRARASLEARVSGAAHRHQRRFRHARGQRRAARARRRRHDRPRRVPGFVAARSPRRATCSAALPATEAEVLAAFERYVARELAARHAAARDDAAPARHAQRPSGRPPLAQELGRARRRQPRPRRSARARAARSRTALRALAASRVRRAPRYDRAHRRRAIPLQ